MKARGVFISAILIVDTFLVSYAIGFNSRHVPLVDPSMKAVTLPPADVKPDAKKPETATVPAKKTETTPVKAKRTAHKKATTGKKHPASKKTGND